MPAGNAKWAEAQASKMAGGENGLALRRRPFNPCGLMPSQPGHVSLLIVDFQKQFLKPFGEPIRAGIQSSLEDYPWVVATRIVPEPGGLIERFKRWQPLPESHPDSGLAVDLQERDPASVRVALKTAFNACSPDTLAWWKLRGVTEVHLCGMDTDLCVMRSALGLMEAGLRPVLLKSLCASSAGEPLHSHALLQFKRLIGKAQIVQG